MTSKSKVSDAILNGSLLAFIAFTVYILYINQEVFYAAQDRSEFIFGAPFFHSLMEKPFGLMRYVGAWLTQFFYHPGVGTGVVMAIWVLIFCVGVKAFRLKGSVMALMLLPVACLLTSIVDLGYWIYIFPERGYWFSQSVGYLIMLLMLWAARCTPRKWHMVWYLIGAGVYPVLGWFALLFVVCLIVTGMEAATKSPQTGKFTWREVLGIVVILFTAGIWHAQGYSNLRFDDVVLAGFPRFETPMDSSERLSVPFWVLAGVTVIIPICGRYLSKGERSAEVVKESKTIGVIRVMVPVLCTVAGIIFTSSLMFIDLNYKEEMRMVRYASDDNWKGVLHIAEANKKPTSTMIFLKNIALMNDGGLLDRSFKYGNNATDINNPDSLHVTLLDIASPLVYYNYGMMNEAIRLNFENAIQAGFSPFYLKMLCRCALAVGDHKLVERYTTILHCLPGYCNWQPAPVTEKIKSLQKCYPDELTGVENSESYLVNGISLWYESDSKVASEQALFYAMLRCDSRRFWPALRNYVKLHLDEEFPLHAQEAYILFMDKAPEEKRMMLPVEQTVYERYKQFWKTLEGLAKPGMTVDQVGEKMLEEYGDTFWWYNIFGRKPINITGNIGNDVHA